MAADANIFQQYLNPVKSVQEYSADLDKQQLNQLQLIAQGRQNDLQGMTVQQQIDDRNALQRAASGWNSNTTPDQRIAALRNSGSPALMTQADALEKQWMDRQKTTADIGKVTADTQASQFKTGLDKQKSAVTQMASFSNPQHAISSLNDAVANGSMPPQVAQLMQTSMPQDPAQFDQWKLRMVVGMIDPDKMAEFLKPHLQTINAGNAQVQQAVDPITGQVRNTASTQVYQSPDNKATNDTSIDNNKRTVGASLTNAAATRDVAAATRYAATAQRDQATEMKLADDYRAQSKEFGAATSAYKQINATLDSATTSPAATLAAATKFMKILDPGSVVRESELGMALAATGVLDRAQNYVNTLQRGKVLTPAQVADFRDISQKMYGAAQQVQQSIDADYKGKANAYGLRPNMVTQELGQNAASPGDMREAVAAEMARRAAAKPRSAGVR